MELEAARSEFEREWTTFRDRVAQQVGTVPRRKGWWVLTLAGAVGLAAGLSLRRRRTRRRESSEELELSRRSEDA